MPDQWNAAFWLLAEILPDDAPSVVVIDEVPYLMERVDAFEGLLRRAWDRLLSRKPVLLLLVGSDLSMMEALNSYDRPFHQRDREMVVRPLTPADIGEMLDLETAAAFDATLITGGLPLICREWQAGASMWEFLEAALDNPISALLVSAERPLAAEFPPQAMGRDVLRAIGSGERTFTNIARAAGGIAHSTLSRSADLLIDKRVVAAELPISLRPSKERRYRVADPYLRFWLAFLDPHMAEIERMRGDLTLARIREQWTSWRGRAIEPLVRESLARILPDRGPPAAPPGSAGTGRAATTSRSTWWVRTGSPWRTDCCSWARSSGWGRSRSTPTTWRPCTNTGLSSPTGQSRSSPSPAAASPARASRPPSARRTSSGRGVPADPTDVPGRPAR